MTARETDMVRNLDVGQEGRKTIEGNMIRCRAVVLALLWLADDGMPDGPRKRGTFEICFFFVFVYDFLYFVSIINKFFCQITSFFFRIN